MSKDFPFYSQSKGRMLHSVEKGYDAEYAAHLASVPYNASNKSAGVQAPHVSGGPHKPASLFTKLAIGGVVAAGLAAGGVFMGDVGSKPPQPVLSLTGSSFYAIHQNGSVLRASPSQGAEALLVLDTDSCVELLESARGNFARVSATNAAGVRVEGHVHNGDIRMNKHFSTCKASF